VDRLPVGICALQDGLFQFTNHALADMFGYGDETLLSGTALLDIVQDDQRQRVAKEMTRVLHGDVDSLCCEFDALRHNGPSFAVELRATRAEVGGRPALVASLVDITDRKAAEAELRTRETQLRALTENAWDVVSIVTPDDVISYMSPSVTRVLGYEPDELVGRHSREFVHPDDVERADEAFHRIIGTPGASGELSIRLRHKDDSWRDVEAIAQIRTDAAGQPLAIINTHDITDQKRAQHELRRKTANVELLEYVAVAANEATDIASAAERCIAHVCTYNDWCTGHLYLRNAEGNMVSSGTWFMSDAGKYDVFRDATAGRVFGPGEGLPGEVMSTGKAHWVRDVTADETFTRRDAALKAGIRGGIACPLLTGSEVVGALEFFADRTLDVDEPLMEVLSHAGTQLGRVVERVQAHEALRQSEGRIRAIVEMSHDAFIAMDMDGRITEWNGQAEATFGWTRAEALGKPMAELVIPMRHRHGHRRAMRRFTRTGHLTQHSRRFEVEALHRDGHEFPVELSISAIPMDGTFLFTAFLHDITTRRQVEQRLKQSEERYDLVARATSDVVWDWNVVSGVLTWNDAIRRTCRYQPDQVGTTMEWWYNHIHPADRERVITTTHAVLNGTAELWSDEYRFQRGDGTYATVLARGHVVRNERSEAVRMIGSMVDITERKLEEEAQRFVAQATVLLDTSLDQEVILTGLARLIVPTLGDFCAIDVLEEGGGIHRAATAHSDPSREALLRSDETLPSDPNRPSEARDLVVEVIRTRQPMLIRECRPAALKALGLSAAHRAVLQKLGTRALMIVPLLTREQVLGAITFGVAESGRGYDLMDLLTAEQLCQRAARTVDNGRLYDNAQRAIRARDEVLAIVSHDLRNPLSTITLSASLLLDQQGERRAAGARFLDIIKRAAEQANRLIKDLLDISSIEAGHFSVNRLGENAADLLEQAREMLAPIAQEKSITLETDVTGAGLFASADVGQIQRVFSNLVGNAIKFTPPGGKITLRTEEVDGEIRFSVTDTGPGIPPEELPHIFDRYWQAMRGDRRGAGLGLSIVRGIVEAHGGRIWVESKVGEGSTFIFTVPQQPPAERTLRRD
jgi:PAS domain S-box-containing protein